MGITISAEGISTNLEKTNHISDRTRADNLKQLRLLLGIGSHYRKIIRGYLTMFRPLIDPQFI